jgi:predicted RNA binding protein YcfA (HicA-like mRNA interferase family)
VTRPQKYRDVVAFLRGQGWELKRQGKGSHEIWADPNGPDQLVVPHHHTVSAKVVKDVIDTFPETPSSWR